MVELPAEAWQVVCTGQTQDVRIPRTTWHFQPSGETVIKNLVSRFVYEDRGQDLIEYALLAGFIWLVAVVAITNVGSGVNGVYSNLDAQVQAIPGGS